jgi:uncharacterized membrane protein (UPF0127 family)
VCAALLVSLTGCDSDGEATSTSAASEPPGTVVPVGFDLAEVTITTAGGGDRPLQAWIADTTDERARGLMAVTDLGDADGMLFVFGDAAVRRFYMWQTPMPLDIAFFAADGAFVSSAAMEPCLEPSADVCARYAPDEPFQFALEVPAGGLDDLGIGAGSWLDQ